MITLIDFGVYQLFETNNRIKILKLNSKSYVWLHAAGIGDILIHSRHEHRRRDLLASGQYRIYVVDGEPEYVDQLHLELMVGTGDWQGYLLPTGLPTENKTRTRLIPVDESVTTHTVRAKVPQAA